MNISDIFEKVLEIFDDTIRKKRLQEANDSIIEYRGPKIQEEALEEIERMRESAVEGIRKRWIQPNEDETLRMVSPKELESFLDIRNAVYQYITGVAYTIAQRDGRKLVTVGDVREARGGIAYN